MGFCDGRRNAFCLYDRNTKNTKIDKIDSQIWTLSENVIYELEGKKYLSNMKAHKEEWTKTSITVIF